MSHYPELTAYAAKQGAPVSAFLKDVYDPQPVMHYCSKHKRERLAIEFENGQSWRYTDDIKPKYGRRTGYERHWYYLDRAIQRAQQTGLLIIINGEGGTTATYHAHGLPTTCVTGGEKSELTALLLNELKTKYPEGEIWIVFDCDPGGRKASPELAEQLTLAGYTARAIDLQLPNKGGDIADFCKLHPDNPLSALAALPDLPKAPEKRRYPPVILQDTETPPELIQAIAAALNAPPPKASGFSRDNVTCPFSENHSHADKNESASFNWKTGAIYCHAAGCGNRGNHGHRAVARRLGFDLRRFDPPKPERRTPAHQDRREALGHPGKLPKTPRTPEPECQPEAAPVDVLPATWIFEIATTFTPGTAMLTRLADELNAAGNLPAFCRADLRRLTEEAGHSMKTNTFDASYKWFVELNCQKSHTGKKEGIPYDFFDILPREERLTRLKAAVWTRLVKEAFPESDRAAALIAFYPRMAIDTLGTVENAGAIVEALNQALPLPEECRQEAEKIYQAIVDKYRAIVKLLEDDTVNRLDPADLPDKARSNPATYLNILRRERYKPYNGMQLSGKQRSALIGILDPRQRYRKERQIGIVTEEVKPKEEIKSIADIDRHRRRHIAHPIKLFALNQAGEVTATMVIADDHKAPDIAFRQRRKAEFVTTQRAAGYRVIVELQARSRIEVNAMPEKKPVEKKPNATEQNTPVRTGLLQNAAKNQPVSYPVDDRPEEIPGRYTDHWLKFHILRRLKRDERGFYTNPATGEIIPKDLTGSLAELIEALTGYRLTGREEQTA